MKRLLSLILSLLLAVSLVACGKSDSPAGDSASGKTESTFMAGFGMMDIKEKITEKDDNLVGNMASEGTTPRQLTDLIGSLCDLTSGSGDKGTPIVYIQGYFDNYTND